MAKRRFRATVSVDLPAGLEHNRDQFADDLIVFLEESGYKNTRLTYIEDNHVQVLKSKRS